MSESTLANKSPGTIFNFGDILNRVVDSAGSVIEQVAPVWLEKELELRKEVPVAQAPTYQSTDPQRQPPANITTNGLTTTGANTKPIILGAGTTTLLIGVGVIGVVIFLATRKG